MPSKTSSGLPLDNFIDGSLRPDGADLADLEAEGRKLAAERERLSKSFVAIPGRKKAMLEELDARAEKVSQATVAAKDHVPLQKGSGPVYEQRDAENRRLEADEAARREAAEKERREGRRRLKEKLLGKNAGRDPVDDD